MKNVCFKFACMCGLTSFCLFFSPVLAIGANVIGFDVSGIKLGMTPEQVVKHLEKLDKGYRVNSIPFISNEVKFIGRVYAKKQGSNYKVYDTLIIDFAPPPHDTVAVSVFRLRSFDPASKTNYSYKNVKNAIYKKYGKPVEIVEHASGGYFFWKKVTGGCRDVMSYNPNNRQYIMQSNMLVNIMNKGIQCPAGMYMDVTASPRYGVIGMRTHLIDYPSLYNAAIENSKMAEDLERRKAEEREKRGRPDDI